VSEPIVWLTIFVLSVFVGIEVISKVSSTLHTPLMSGANAIHGIILLGAIIVTGTTDNTLAVAVGLVAIVLAAVNMVGGFVVTDRMLQMFTRKKPAKAVDSGESKVACCPRGSSWSSWPAASASSWPSRACRAPRPPATATCSAPPRRSWRARCPSSGRSSTSTTRS